MTIKSNFVRALGFLLFYGATSHAEPIVIKENSGELTVIVAEGERGEGSHGSFNFGVWHAMDDSRENQLYANVDERTLWKGSPSLNFSHIFVLQNKTAEALIISKIDASGQILEVKSPDITAFPYAVAPGEKLKLEAIFAYDNLRPGPKTGIVVVHRQNLNAPLATLSLSAFVESGISFLPKELSFGNVPVGVGAVRTFTLTFDKRANVKFSPFKLRLVSNNPNLKIIRVRSSEMVMDVKTVGDTIQFPNHDREFPKDLILTFQAFLSKNTPAGEIKSKVKLIVMRLPSFALVKDVEIPVRGQIIGLADAAAK